MENKKRCGWVKDPLMKEYHDKEWGVPLKDDQKIFEFLILESMQAGLSWQTILKKRENFRRAFDNFRPEKISLYQSRKIQSLLKDSGIIRNQKKIKAAINNARCFLEIKEEFGTFKSYCWQFVNNKPIINKYQTLSDIPASTAISENFSKDLKKRGFQFLGPTTLYAHMQAAGMVNDHLKTCFRYQEISEMMLKFKL